MVLLLLLRTFSLLLSLWGRFSNLLYSSLLLIYFVFLQRKAKKTKNKKNIGYWYERVLFSRLYIGIYGSHITSHKRTTLLHYLRICCHFYGCCFWRFRILPYRQVRAGEYYVSYSWCLCSSDFTFSIRSLSVRRKYVVYVRDEQYFLAHEPIVPSSRQCPNDISVTRISLHSAVVLVYESMSRHRERFNHNVLVRK